MKRLKFAIAATILVGIAGCSAMMLGGGGGSSYPAECTEEQRQSEEGCKE